MRSRIRQFVVALAFVLAIAPAMADNLEGSDAFLCTAVEVTACYTDGECITVPPWSLDVPQFIEIDLKKGTLATTVASGENRSTPIKHQEREDGLIFLQGVEAGRAFSFAITEATGMLTVAVARDEISVGIFGACTPLPNR